VTYRVISSSGVINKYIKYIEKCTSIKCSRATFLTNYSHKALRGFTGVSLTVAQKEKNGQI